MWIIGLLIGLLAGELIDHGEGAVFGAALGAIAGTLLSVMKRLNATSDLQAQIDSLEARLTALQQQFGTTGTAAADAQSIETVPVETGHVETGTIETGPVETGPIKTAPEQTAAEARVPADTAPTPASPTAEPAAARVQAPSTMSVGAQSRAGNTGTPLTNGNDITRLWKWLSGGNALVRVGVVVLFFGVAFLLKYAYEHTHVPVELRLTGVAIGAIAMLVIGWRLRSRNPVYALAVQGGGTGVLYLVIFGAFRLFKLLPAEVAFGLLIAVAVLSAILAILQNAQSLAVLAVSGGFLAPILASTGSGSHVMLFSYYAVLNLGILAIAMYKAWRPLNVLGFVFTFSIGSMWGARFYRDDMFASTEPFLIFFTLLYILVAVIFAFRQAPRLKHYVDSTLIFGTPLVAFGLQTRLIRPFEYGAAWSAVALSALYLVMATLLYQRKKETLRMLVEAFFALGVIFATLAIPLAVDGRWTSAAWALEGAAAYWVGVRQARRAPRVFGLLLQFAAGIAFLADYRAASADIPVLNSFYMGTVFIALAGLFSNYTIERRPDKVGYLAMQVSIGIFSWGLLWWVFGGLNEINVHVPRSERLAASLLFLAATCTAFSVLFGRGWWIARFPALAMVAVITIAVLKMLIAPVPSHPLAGFGLIAWPLAFAAHFFILHRDDAVRTNQTERGIAPLGYLSGAHTAGVWLITVAGALELSWLIDQVVASTRIWSMIVWALVPVALLSGVTTCAVRARWPVNTYSHAYLWAGLLPLVAFLYLWSLYVNWESNGNPAPLPYLPFINPLDIAQMLVFAAAILWWRSLSAAGIEQASKLPVNVKWGLVGGLVFYWLNGVLLRTLHHWAGVPHDFSAMMRSALVQTSMSIFWTLLALTAMLYATRRFNRWLWLTGAALMAVVVIKLFIIDLANIGGIERIVSFLAVGVLMLVIGYVAPVPPRQRPEAA